MYRFLAVLMLSLTAAVATPAHATKPAAAAVLPRDSVYQLPLTLTDQHGTRFDWRTLRGTPRVLTMFYASCQFTCPLTIDAGKAIQRQLTPAQQQHLGIVMVSIDPARDTPAALQKVAGDHKLDARWTLAAPRPGDVRAAAGVLGIRYRQLANGDFNHSTALVLVDADGRELARTEQVGSQPDPAFVAAVRKAVVH